MPTRVSDLHVVANTPLPSPLALMAEIPRSEAHAAFVARAREEIARILSGEDDRFLLVVGPCSIHDLKAGRDYAEKLAGLAREVARHACWWSCGSILRSRARRSAGRG